jgi:hypothetical protein
MTFHHVHGAAINPPDWRVFCACDFRISARVLRVWDPSDGAVHRQLRLLIPGLAIKV